MIVTYVQSLRYTAQLEINHGRSNKEPDYLTGKLLCEILSSLSSLDFLSSMQKERNSAEAIQSC